jgi:cell division protein FtsB
MKVDVGIWGKLSRLVTFLLFLAGIMALALWYLPLIRENERRREEILRLDNQIRKEQERERQLKASIEALKHDPKAIERAARDRLHFSKPNETIIRFEPPATNQLGQP